MDTSKLATDFMTGDRVLMSFVNPTEEVLLAVNSLCAKILSRMDKAYYHDMMIVILREMIINAFKANAKRVFYGSLDSLESDDNAESLDEFRKAFICGKDKLIDELIRSPYRIDFWMQKAGFNIMAGVRNNVKIYADERRKILERIEFAHTRADFQEAYKNLYDPSEGAGLGILICLVLLKNACIGTDNFTVEIGDGYVESSVVLPYRIDQDEAAGIVKKSIIDEVVALPTFPENISALMAMCNDPGVGLDGIAEIIDKDPSLTADVLKFSNSAGFFIGRRIESILDAIKIIGLENLKIILTAAGAQKILSKRYKRFDLVWKQSVKVAEYSKHLCLLTGKGAIAERAYIAGLLHDIGYILLLSSDESVADMLADRLHNIKVKSSRVIEEVHIGMSHTEIGHSLAVKWNFPEFISDSIKFHHAPFKCPETSGDICRAVHLADMLCGIEAQKYSYSYVEKDIMNYFSVKNEDELKALHISISNYGRNNG